MIKRAMLKALLGIITFGCISNPSFALDGALGQYISEQDFHQMSNQIMDRAEVRGLVVRLDTREALRCLKIKSFIRRFQHEKNNVALEDLCKRGTVNPYKDLVVIQTNENEQLINFLRSGMSVGVSAYQSQQDVLRPELPNMSLKNEEFLLSPLFATLLSESINTLRSRVRENNGALASSQMLGRAVMVITNPAESVAFIFNEIFQKAVFTSGETQVKLRDYGQDLFVDQRTGHSIQMNMLEFQMVLHY